MKTIYVVRHGESEGNAGVIRQSASTPLTEHGRAQAGFIAERAKNLRFDTIISSTMTRAIETAAIISETTGKNLEYSDLFTERRRPTIVQGQHKDAPHVLEAEAAIQANFTNAEFRHSDEENFSDLRRRAASALTYLIEREEQELLVVSHGFFTRILIASALFGTDLSAEACEQVIQKFRMNNTGITILAYDRDDLPNEWCLMVWNDHAHLG